jgi:hypothetical protein
VNASFLRIRPHTDVVTESNISRSHECERCTHECVRHNNVGNGQ